ncbi:hypothetical protein [Streptomyces sp. NPDC059398]|uniref:hypothetical protein n=1 Tax=Streptomyces sp. NPDC059398 TaxID=3346820 RepID=UPI003690E610
MADEQCEWLDKDTADRLLSGGPVGAVDGHARAQAARLRAALDGAVPSAGWSDDSELPGEKAALEAFRLARDGSDAEPLVAALGTEGTAPGAERRVFGTGPSVRGTGRSVFGTRRAVFGTRRSVFGTRRAVRGTEGTPGAGRWGRPVRFSVAAVVAGCALSGVAVAAGAGMLPSPFGSSEPMPASSVSSAATPRPLASGSPSGTPGSASPGPDGRTPADVTPGPGARSPRMSPPASEAGGDVGDRDSDRGRSSGEGGADRQPTAGAGAGAGSQDRPTPSGHDRRSAADVLRKVTAACRDYRAGRIVGERRRSLEAKAGGAENIEKFCGRVLGSSGSDGNHRISFVPSSPLRPASPAGPSPSRSAGASPSPSLNSPASPSPDAGNGAATGVDG